MINFPKSVVRCPSAWFLLLILITCFNLGHARSLRFADDLYAQGDFHAAAIEYKRILFEEATDSADSLYVIQMLMRSLFQVSDRTEMFQVSHAYAGFLGPRDLAVRYNAMLMMLEGYYLPAYSLLDTTTDARARLLRGLSLEYLGKSKAATTQLRDLSSYDSGIAHLADSALRVQQEARKPHSPSPYLAGVLGVIPGAGYAVTGRVETALASLVLNSALLISSIELYKNDLHWSAGIVFSVFTGFYLGNIYGSAAAAAKDRAIYKAAKLDEYLKTNVEELLRGSDAFPATP